LPASGVLRAELIQHLDSANPANVLTNAADEVTAWTDLSGKGNNATTGVGSSLYPASYFFPTGRAGVAFTSAGSSLELLNASKTDALLDFTGGAVDNTGFAIMLTLRVETQKTDDWNDLIGVTSSFNAGGLALR
jgi:hypothetical protein